MTSCTGALHYWRVTFGLLLFTGSARLVPLVRDYSLHTATTDSVRNGDECSYVGKMQSDNPCTPWCFCRHGRASCVQMHCNDIKAQNPTGCNVIHVSGRCCPTLLCSSANGTTSVKYELPLTRIPPEMLPPEDAAADDKD